MSDLSKAAASAFSQPIKILGPLAYRGKAGCRSITCTRRSIMVPIEEDPCCFGWHCSYCDEPCGSQGHNCDAAKTLLDEAKQVLKEEESGPTS